MSKPLPMSSKTIGDAIHVRRKAKSLTPGHLALKMGIATAVVCSWESGVSQPSHQQMEEIARLLEFKPFGASSFLVKGAASVGKL